MALIELHSPRLVIKTPEPADAPRLHAYALRNRARLHVWEPTRQPSYYELEHWVSYASQAEPLAARREGVGFVFVPREDPSGPVVGQCRLSVIVPEPFHAANLGYSLDEHAQGQGYMTEALREVIRYAFYDLHLHRLQANYMPRNEASGRVLSRLGFVQEGLARQYLRINGRWEDHVLTSLTHPAWEEAPAEVK